MYCTNRIACCSLAAVVLLCSGCATIADGFQGLANMIGGSSTDDEVIKSDYGIAAEVRETVDIVKASGEKSVISSQAIRLPNNPLSSITAFDYEFPGDCGGHHFRVYEAEDMQILEYMHIGDEGDAYVIRDYVTGPSPFIGAGLWTAYDHTADGISDMDVQFEQRGTRLLIGTYSQGPVSGLDPTAKDTLGMAYNRALRDASVCNG